MSELDRPADLNITPRLGTSVDWKKSRTMAASMACEARLES
jgi:hypothetical protein